MSLKEVTGGDFGKAGVLISGLHSQGQGRLVDHRKRRMDANISLDDVNLAGYHQFLQLLPKINATPTERAAF